MHRLQGKTQALPLRWGSLGAGCLQAQLGVERT